MTRFLDAAELKHLTGRSYAPAQRRVLAARGIRYTTDDFGRPIVLWAAVEHLLLGKTETPAPAPAPSPDFTVFPKLA